MEASKPSWHTVLVVVTSVLFGWYLALTLGPERSTGWMAAARSWMSLHVWNRHAAWELGNVLSWSWNMAEAHGWLDTAAAAMSQYSLPLFLPLLAMQHRGRARAVN